MRYKSAVFGTLILLGIGIAGLHAQEAIPATGGDAYGNGGSSSYTVGQLVFNMNTGTNGSEGQGVQQPYEISVIVGFEEVHKDLLECTAYPNPTTDYLLLKLNSDKFQDLSYQLYSADGILLQSNDIQSNEISISMKDLASATYFLRLTENSKEIRTFKIVKN